MKFVLGFMVMLVCVQISESGLGSLFVAYHHHRPPRRHFRPRPYNPIPECSRYRRLFSCGAGWVKYGRRLPCMKIFGYANFKTAQAICHRHRAKLVSVHNWTENRRLTCLTYRHFQKIVPVWIGLVREGHGWRWTDGSRFHYKHWMKGEPNNWRTGRCVTTNFMHHGRWDDTRCEGRHPVVCFK
ncbi:C-type lectin lectoxin-Lio2-like [Genypterus blacodes]|uniref:C-type lectin lectoxin-Lio2-like n=1 Tax=Genypterus blacodes TaxID=154954 RepID=UPI003F7582D6